MFHTRLFECLQACGVRYLVVGGLAVNLHGTGRRQDAADVEQLRRLRERGAR